ncbi:MAG: ATP-dependent sacrificial sulfur transferase LarE [Bacteroidales bacterium]|nr:ATP-dependent sacrificial sulfur transferase LarE [Bacteroidales bacterium]
MDKKIIKLDSILNELAPLAVAFSGGVDSSFLLHRARKVINDSVVAVTIKTPYMPEKEIAEAVSFAGNAGVKHKILNTGFPESIRHNPLERCYLCKKKLFTELIAFASQAGYTNVADGTNADDEGDFRPGMRALSEMGVRSPLREAGLTKNEIRAHLRDEGLEVWDKPAMACLLTRIPYDTAVSEEMLRMIENAEYLMFEAGYPGTRVRIHGDLARIECLPGFLDKMVQKGERDNITAGLKKLGFRYISLDLEGYRTGSSNPQNKMK